MPASNQTYWTVDRIMRLIIGLAIAAGLVMLLRYLSHVLLPFFAACLISYILEPLVDLNRRWIRFKGRVVASLVTLLEVGSVLAVVVIVCLPSVISDMKMLGNILHEVSTGQRSISPFYHETLMFFNRFFDGNNLEAQLSPEHLEDLLSKGSTLLQRSIDIILHTLEWLLTLIYVIFIMIDYPQIARGFKLLIPARFRAQGISVVHDVQNGMDHYFRGQGLVALCACILYCIGFKIVGMPLAIPMGVLIGILYMIPYFQYVTIVPVALICFIYSLGGTVSFGVLAGKCALVYVVSQCICDYIITPHVMKKEMGLNPAVILLALSVWGTLLGIIGMIIALPMTALAMAYYERYISCPVPQAPQNPQNPQNPGPDDTSKGDG